MVLTRNMKKKQNFIKLRLNIRDLPEEVEKYIKSYLVDINFIGWYDIYNTKIYNSYQEYISSLRLKIHSDKLNKKYFIRWLKGNRYVIT
tara:strand:+ start:401 stop:667 length:267 start_codon:yes stop_codon:yes gene_type:complete